MASGYCFWFALQHEVRTQKWGYYQNFMLVLTFVFSSLFLACRSLNPSFSRFVFDVFCLCGTKKFHTTLKFSTFLVSSVLL